MSAEKSNGNDLLEQKLEELEKIMFKDAKTSLKRYYVSLNNGFDAKLWTLSAESQTKSDESKPPMVLIHGYLSAIGPWRHNIDVLSESRHVHAFDLLGFGRSSRIQFSNDPLEAEQQFVESIEEWRREMKLEKFILMGHSFGGYLSTLYALKYPQNLTALILEDPWGFPDPNAGGAPIHRSKLAKDVFMFGYSMMKSYFQTNNNTDLSNLDDGAMNSNYLFLANSFKPASGREAFDKYIAGKYGAVQRPLLKKFHEIDQNLPIWFLFGENSWIKCTDGLKAMSLRPDTSKTFVKIVNQAGHKIHIDNPSEFNNCLKGILDHIDKIC